jgi:hypothetical protein
MKRLAFLMILVPVMASAQFVPGTWHWSGTLSVTTSSVLINTMTLSATGQTLPANLSGLIVFNPGSSGDVAVCPKGGTCTCPENGIATTNGDTILKSGGSWTYVFSPAIASSVPSIVACTSTATVEFSG